MSRGNVGSTGLSRLQSALIIGTPVIIGVGYYLYKKNSKSSLGDDGKPTSPKKIPLKNIKDQSISLDGTESEKDVKKKKKAELENEKLSPLKEATNYNNEGNVCYRKGKYDEAILFYDKAIDKCPPQNHNDLAIFYQNRAAAYEMLKKWSKDPCVVKEVPKSEDPKGYVPAKMAFDSGNFDDVIPACTEEIESSESESQYKSEALLMRGTFHLLSANYADSKTDLDAVINNGNNVLDKGETSERQFFINSVRLWNNLPRDIRRIEDVRKVKKEIKNYLSS